MSSYNKPRNLKSNNNPYNHEIIKKDLRKIKVINN